MVLHWRSCFLCARAVDLLLLFAKKLASVIVFFNFRLLDDILMTENKIRYRIIIAIYIFTCKTLLLATETSRKGVGVSSICGNCPISRVILQVSCLSLASMEKWITRSGCSLFKNTATVT